MSYVYRVDTVESWLMSELHLYYAGRKNVCVCVCVCGGAFTTGMMFSLIALFI